MENVVIPMPARSARRPLLLLIVPAFLLLSLLLIYPAGPDQSIYMVGGGMIADGGVYYREILDVKPPPIHWIAAAAQIVFGRAIESLRLVDLLLQVVTIALVATYLRRIGSRDVLLIFATLYYAIGYLALGTEGTFQPESWTGLCLIAALLLRHRGGRFDAVGIGLIGAILFALKFTLILPLFAFLLFPSGAGRDEGRPQADPTGDARGNGIQILGGFAIGVSLFFSVVLLSGGGDGLKETMSFLSGRQAWTIAHLEPIAMSVRGLVRWAGTYLGPIPLIMSLIALATIIDFYRRPRRHQLDELFGVQAGDAGVIALSALLLLVSALAELMTLPYQLGRVLLPVVLLTSLGIVRSAHLLKRRVTSLRRASSILLLMVVAIVGGPLPRVIHEVHGAVEARRLSTGLIQPLYLHDRAQRNELDTIVSFIERTASSDDDIAIVSGYAGYLSLLLSTKPSGGVLHGHQLIARFSPSAWRQRFLTVIEEKQPLFLVVDRNDSAAAGFVGAVSSIDWVRRSLGAAELDRRYREGVRTESYFIFERVGNAADSFR